MFKCLCNSNWLSTIFFNSKIDCYFKVLVNSFAFAFACNLSLQNPIASLARSLERPAPPMHTYCLKDDNHHSSQDGQAVRHPCSVGDVGGFIESLHYIGVCARRPRPTELPAQLLDRRIHLHRLRSLGRHCRARNGGLYGVSCVSARGREEGIPDGR